MNKVATNLFNHRDAAKSALAVAKSIPDTRVTSWFETVAARWLRQQQSCAIPVLPGQSDLPAWAEQDLRDGRAVHRFVMSSESQDKLSNISHWLKIAVRAAQRHKNAELKRLAAQDLGFLYKTSVDDANKKANAWYRTEARASGKLIKSTGNTETDAYEIFPAPHHHVWERVSTRGMLEVGEDLINCLRFGNYRSDVKNGNTDIWALRDPNGRYVVALTVKIKRENGVTEKHVSECKGHRNEKAFGYGLAVHELMTLLHFKNSAAHDLGPIGIVDETYVPFLKPDLVLSNGTQLCLLPNGNGQNNLLHVAADNKVEFLIKIKGDKGSESIEQKSFFEKIPLTDMPAVEKLLAPTIQFLNKNAVRASTTLGGLVMSSSHFRDKNHAAFWQDKSEDFGAFRLVNAVGVYKENVVLAQNDVLLPLLKEGQFNKKTLFGALASLDGDAVQLQAFTRWVGARLHVDLHSTTDNERALNQLPVFRKKPVFALRANIENATNEEFARFILKNGAFCTFDAATTLTPHGEHTFKTVATDHFVWLEVLHPARGQSGVLFFSPSGSVFNDSVQHLAFGQFEGRPDLFAAAQACFNAAASGFASKMTPRSLTGTPDWIMFADKFAALVPVHKLDNGIDVVKFERRWYGKTADGQYLWSFPSPIKSLVSEVDLYVADPTAVDRLAACFDALALQFRNNSDRDIALAAFGGYTLQNSRFIKRAYPQALDLVLPATADRPEVHINRDAQTGTDAAWTVCRVGEPGNHDNTRTLIHLNIDHQGYLDGVFSHHHMATHHVWKSAAGIPQMRDIFVEFVARTRAKPAPWLHMFLGLLWNQGTLQPAPDGHPLAPLADGRGVLPVPGTGLEWQLTFDGAVLVPENAPKDSPRFVEVKAPAWGQQRDDANREPHLQVSWLTLDARALESMKVLTAALEAALV